MSLEPYKAGTHCKIKSTNRVVTIVEATIPTMTYNNAGKPPEGSAFSYWVTGRFGIGSFDAMIINLFLNSKFSMMVTADRDLVYVIEALKPDGKFVCIPDRLNV